MTRVALTLLTVAGTLAFTVWTAMTPPVSPDTTQSLSAPLTSAVVNPLDPESIEYVTRR